MYESTIRVEDPALASRLASMVVRSECYAGIRGVRVALVNEDHDEGPGGTPPGEPAGPDDGPRGVLRPFRT
jgi:hypothetical protein